ncbi:hypothetical protein [Okeania sp. SIO1I7]|nr:hypothetical protein [Okeania sp. SIO1I7]
MHREGSNWTWAKKMACMITKPIWSNHHLLGRLIEWRSLKNYP